MTISRRRRPLLAFGSATLTLLTCVNGFSSAFYSAATGRNGPRESFFNNADAKEHQFPSRLFVNPSTATNVEANTAIEPSITIFEKIAKSFVSDDYATNPAELHKFVQYITMLRVGLPALAAASLACLSYPYASMTLAGIINDAGAFSVIAQDSSQYIQNILTTCGLMFSILTGYSWYFLYMQQESIYLALYEEVTAAKSLLEQISLVCEGRKEMYHDIIHCIHRYVQEDMTQFKVEPAILLSSRPVDDPLQDIMYLTSVGEPSIVYQTVRSLRQARAHRLGALQRKLPQIHMILLWSLAAAVLCTFPVLGAGVQTIGGPGILHVQSFYLSFIVFGMTLTLGVINELYKPAGDGAYNVVTVLSVMVAGLEEELEGRLADKYVGSTLSPTNDVTKPMDTYNEPYNYDEAGVMFEAVPLPVLTDTRSDLGSERHNDSVMVENATVPWFGKRIINRIRNGRKQ